MMDGMGFLLSSLGIDPEQLKNAAGQVQTTANEFLTRLSRIERKLDYLASCTLEPNELGGYTAIQYTPADGGLTNGAGSDSSGGGGSR